MSEIGVELQLIQRIATRPQELRTSFGKHDFRLVEWMRFDNRPGDRIAKTSVSLLTWESHRVRESQPAWSSFVFRPDLRSRIFLVPAGPGPFALQVIGE